MHLYGKVIVIKRNGTDGAHFPLTTKCCVFGRGQDSDIRIQLPTVDTTQCQILVDDKEHVFIQSISSSSTTLVNDRILSEALTALSHGDIITIVDRQFRFEFPVDSRFYPHKSPKSKSPRTPKRSPMTKLPSSSEKSSRVSQPLAPVTPLSPRTDNVPPNAKSPRSAKKVLDAPTSSTGGEEHSSTPARQSYGSAKKGSSPEPLFSLSPVAFYKAADIPGSSKGIAGSQKGKGKKLDTSLDRTLQDQSQAYADSPSAGRKKSPGSPYTKTPVNLRKSIADLRRRSMPVLETEEYSVQSQRRNQPDMTSSTQVGNKRKSTGFSFLSAKRKRVSFGPNLSPEHFDKTLPPKTPIKKGATPSRIIRQERKSLLKMKSPGRKSTSPGSKLLAKMVSTSPSSQVFEVIVNPSLSPAHAQADSTKRQSPKSGVLEVVSRKSLRTESENAASPVSTPKSLVLKKDGSPLSIEKSGHESLQKLTTPRRSFSNSMSRKSLSLQSSAKSSSDSSLRKSVTPRKSNSFEKSAMFTAASSPKAMQQNASFSESLPTVVDRKYITPIAANTSLMETSVRIRKLSTSPALSQDLFSQVALESEEIQEHDSLLKLTKSGSSHSILVASPTGIKRMLKTPKQKQAAHISPAAMRRLMKTPKVKRLQASPSSPTGIKNLIKTPRNRPVNQAVQTPSALKRLLKTPNVKPASDLSYIGVKEMMKSPRRVSSDISFTGVSTMFSSPPSEKRPVGRPPSEKRSVGRPSLVKSPVGRPCLVKSPVRRPSSVKRSVGRPPSEKRSVGRPPSEKRSVGWPSLVKSPVGRPSLVKSPLGWSSLVKSPVGLPSLVNSPVGLPSLVNSPVGLPSLVNSPVGLHSLANSPVGRPSLANSPVGRPSLVNSPVGRPSLVKSPVGRPSLVKSPVGRPSLVKSPVGRPSLVKSPVGRPSLVNSPVGRPSLVNSPVRRPSLVKSPVSQLSSVKRSVGRPPSVKRSIEAASLDINYMAQSSSKKSPVRQLLLEKSPVGRHSLEKTPVEQPPSEKRPVGRPPSIKIYRSQPSVDSPVEQPPSEKRPVGRPPSAKRPVGQLPSEKRPVGRPPSAKRPMEQSASEKRPVGRPKSTKRPMEQSASEKRPVGRPKSTKLSLGHPLSAKKTPSRVNVNVEKIISPAQDLKKIEALRAIHGHGLTPKRASFKVQTSASGKRTVSNLFRKTPGKKTWADIVKSGVEKPATVKKTELPAVKVVTKRISSLNKKVHKTPKALVKLHAPTTGHADSPATIIVGRKFKGTRTPKLLPRRGRKSLSKASRKSVGNVSFTGMAEMFAEPVELVINESSLYADIPDTPDGPNEMFVSPLSHHTSSLSGRKSTNLTGVRELFMRKKVQDTNFIGVKELFTSSSVVSAVSPSGLRRLMKTPKKRSSGENLVGVKRLLATPKNKAVLASPVSLDNLFTTPALSNDTVSSKRQSELTQAARSGESILVSPKTGQRGRKRKADQPATLSHKWTTSTVPEDFTDKKSTVLSPNVRGRRGRVQVKKTPTIAVIELHESTPQTKRSAENVEIDHEHISLPTRVGRRGQANKKSAANTKAVTVLVDDKHISSPVNVGARGRRGRNKIKETVIIADSEIVRSPPKAGRGRRQIKIESTETVETATLAINEEHTSFSTSTRHGRKESKGNLKAQGRSTVSDVELTESHSKTKGRSSRKVKESVLSSATLTVDGTTPQLANKVFQSKSAVIKSVSAESVPVAVIKQSPKVTRGRRGQSKVTESVSVGKNPSPNITASSRRRVIGQTSVGKPLLPSAEKISKTTTNSRQDEGESVQFETGNLSTVGKRGGNRSKLDTVKLAQATETATSSPKGRSVRGKRNKVVPVSESLFLPGASGVKEKGLSSTNPNINESVSSVLGKVVSQRAGGVKRKAEKTTSSVSKKVKVASPVHISPVKARTTRRQNKAQVKSPNNLVALSPGRRGRPKKDAQVIAAVPVLASPASLISQVSPAGRRGRPKKAAAGESFKIATPSTGKRGRPKKNVQLEEISLMSTKIRELQEASALKGRRGQVKKTVASPPAAKKGTKAASKSAMFKSDMTKVSPKLTRRRKL